MSENRQMGSVVERPAAIERLRVSHRYLALVAVPVLLSALAAGSAALVAQPDGGKTGGPGRRSGRHRQLGCRLRCRSLSLRARDPHAALPAANELEELELQLELHLRIARTHADLAELDAAESSLATARALAERLDEPESWMQLWNQQATFESYRVTSWRRWSCASARSKSARTSILSCWVAAHQPGTRLPGGARLLLLPGHSRSSRGTRRPECHAARDARYLRDGDPAVCSRASGTGRGSSGRGRCRNAQLESWAIGELGLVSVGEGDLEPSLEAFQRAIELARQATTRATRSSGG